MHLQVHVFDFTIVAYDVLATGVGGFNLASAIFRASGNGMLSVNLILSTSFSSFHVLQSFEKDVCFSEQWGQQVEFLHSL